MSKKGLFILVMFVVSVTDLKAQSADDVLRYSLEYPSCDALSLVVPATSQATGFGTFQDNPASAALFEKSFFSFDLSNRYVDETGRYLGNSSTFSDNQISIGDLGFVYKVPTTRGSLVVGAGYSQTTDYNRALSGSGRNSQTTITDFYNSTPDDSLFFAAFDAYAIDFATTDSSYSETASIFRIGFNQYPGINQDFELTEQGQLGEYSAFLASEVLENLSLGASIGYLSGTYSYRRTFLESDRQNDYNAVFIDSNGDGQPDTDIDQISSRDRIDSDIEAFSARLGLVYQPTEQINIGASYQFPSRLYIDEQYNTTITSTFDNGRQFQDDAPGRFSYKITRPSQLKVGFTIKDLSRLTLSGSAETIFYTNARIDFEELELNPLENDINGTVRNSFKDVVNFRAGAEYQLNEQFTPRLGYAYYPSPQKGLDSDRQFISGGFSAELTKGLLFDFGLQYSFWDDENALYSTPSATEVAREEVTRLNVMVGIRMTL